MDVRVPTTQLSMQCSGLQAYSDSRRRVGQPKQYKLCDAKQGRRPHLAEPQLLDDAPHARLPPLPDAVRRQPQASVEAEVLPHRRRAGQHVVLLHVPGRIRMACRLQVSETWADTLWGSMMNDHDPLMLILRLVSDM